MTGQVKKYGPLKLLKLRGCSENSLSSYDFSTLQEELKGLIEWYFQGKFHSSLHVTKTLSLLLSTKTDINVGPVKTCAKPEHMF